VHINITELSIQVETYYILAVNIIPTDIKFGEVLGSSEFIDEFGDEREWVFVLDCHRV